MILMDDRTEHSSSAQSGPASPGNISAPTEIGGKPAFTAERSWQQQLAATNPNIYLVGSIQEFAAYLKNRDPTWTPPQDSPTFFLRENYGTRELSSVGLRLVDDEWFGPWAEIQETFSQSSSTWSCSTDLMRQGWEAEQLRRLFLCTRCQPGT